MNARYSRIAHAFLPVAAPVADDSLESVISALNPPADASLLDIGCGRGEILLRFLARHVASGVGIDIDAVAIEEARDKAAAAGLAGRARFEVTAAADYAPPGAIDLCICVGASHALGGLEGTLSWAAGHLAPAGQLLLGAGYWKRPPVPDYLDAFGGSADALCGRFEVVELAESHGFTCTWSRMSSESDWDRYEGLYRLAMSQWLAANPADADAEGFRRRSETWYRSYLRWGRDTMGFGLWLFALKDRRRAQPPAGRNASVSLAQ